MRIFIIIVMTSMDTYQCMDQVSANLRNKYSRKCPDVKEMGTEAAARKMVFRGDMDIAARGADGEWHDVSRNMDRG